MKKHYSTTALQQQKFTGKSLAFTFVILFVIFFQPYSFAQTAVARIWTDTFGVQDTSLKTPLVTDSLLNTFIAGTVQNTNSGVDVLLRKLDAHGDLIWQTNYTNSGAYRDQATDIALDDSGNVYLCGASYINGNHFDFLVLKFDPSGNLLWDYTYNANASLADGATALALSNGSVFVTGPATFTGSYIDFLTLRISSAGTLLWQSTYNYVNFADVPFDIVVQDGNVFVTGGSQNNFSDWDYATLQMLETNGNAVDTSRTGGTGIGFEYATEAVADNDGFYYLTGTFYNNGSKDFKTIKFDASLNVVWAATFDFDGEDDEALSMAVDTSGNVYVAGVSSDSSNKQFTIVKYNSSGTQQWVHRSGGINNDRSTRITCDESGNVYATGERHNGFNLDFYTLALDEQGNVLWSKLFNGGSNGDDKANMIAVEDQYIIVSGTTTINGNQEYISIAYGTFKMSLPPDTGNAVSSSPNWFYPQSGQILNDTLGTANIQYYTLHHGPALFIKDEILSFVWAKTDTSSSTLDTLQRIDQVIFNAQQTRVYEYEESKNFLNYYLAHCASGITNVKGFKWLSIPDVYRNVNLYYTFNQGGIKQTFVSMPGTKPKIELKYLGADTLLIDTIDGSLEIKGSTGSMKFSRPYAYEIDAQGNIIPGSLFYPAYHQISLGRILIDNISYNISNALVVVMDRWHPFNPTGAPQDNLNWSTFFGTTTGSEFVEATCTTTNDDFCVLGNSEELFYPTLSGITIPPGPNLQYQNGFLLRLSPTKSPEHLVFFGGSYTDNAEDVVAGKNDQCIVTFNTNSDDIVDISNVGLSLTTGPTNQNTFGYIIVFNPDGTIAMDSYIPTAGGGTLYSRSVAYDPVNDKICIVGETNTASGFPLEPLTNAYNQGFGAASYNGFIMELDATFQPTWSTLFGGDGRESISGVDYLDDHLVIMGRTSVQDLSTDNPNNNPCEPTSDGSFPNCVYNTTGTYNQNEIKGDYDNFFAIFDADKKLIWSTPFGGDGGEVYLLGSPDHYDRLEANSSGFYFLGLTNDESNFPFTPNANFFQSFTANAITYTNFIGKFSISELGGIELKWCSFIEGMEISDISCNNNLFGIIGINIGNALELNNCTDNQQPNTYSICNNNGLAYIQTANSINRTCIKMFDNNENLIWSTLYGDNTPNNGSTITFSSDEILIGGSLPLTTSPWTLADIPGPQDYFQNNNLGGFNEMALASFALSSVMNIEKKELVQELLSLYPNPIESWFSINNASQITAIEISNILGQSIYQNENFQAQNNERIPFPETEKGMYVVRIKNTKGLWNSYKVIKK
jgi:hypothetical protein